MPYEYLEHLAEVGVRATGRTLPEALAAAAQGLAGIQVDREELAGGRTFFAAGEGNDREEAVVDWLNALLAAQDAEGLLLLDAAPPRVTEAPGRVRIAGTATGVPRSVAEGHGRTEVKAVTWQGLAVRVDPDEAEVRFVVDV